MRQYLKMKHFIKLLDFKLFKTRKIWLYKAWMAQLAKNLPAVWETCIQSMGWEDPLEKGKATHSSILAWRIRWTVWPMGSQRVRHDWVTFTFTCILQISSLWTQSWKVMLWKRCTQYVSKFGKSAVVTGLEKVSFHSNTKERQCQRMVKIPHNCTYLTH